VELPGVLPARLTTLQQACTETAFNANPASCPPGSIAGYARALTPILDAPLEGPAYFISHGGARFPDLVAVLQGEGITLDLTGETAIDSTTGNTSSTFNNVPDQPLSNFELTLPEGPHSALTTEQPGRTNLCTLTKTVLLKQTLVKRVHDKTKRVTIKVKKTRPATPLMPTTIIAQNGAVVKQRTKITTTGCSAPKKTVKKKA
jgi:hypothetical protein